MEMKRITILVPCYNEEAVLPVFYMKLCEIVKNMDCYSRYQFFVLFVDDGSDDKTLEIMKQLHNHNHNVSYLSLSRNFGKEVAMLAGMDYVDSDAVIIMDADLQDPPDLIPQMICEWEHGYNSVYAKRRSRNGETWMKKMTAHIYYRIYASLTHMPDTVDVGDFRLLDRQCIEALRTIRERERYTKGLFNWIGYRQKAVLYDRPPRKYGNTKWTYWRLIQLALEGVTSFSTIPLHISSWLGMIVSACSFIYTIFIVMRTLIYGGDVPGYPSLVAIILFVGGVQLIVLGIIGEYLGRIFKESKRRPAYLIDEFNGDKVYGNKAEPLL